MEADIIVREFAGKYIFVFAGGVVRRAEKRISPVFAVITVT
jgi:hypothetical protein